MENTRYANYTQISPERDVNAEAFSKGQINFKMNMDSMSRWNPYRSYLRMRVKLETVVGGQLTLNDEIGPNMFQGDCFWQQMNISCAGTKVSEVDDYYQQCASLRSRYSITEGRRKEFLAHTNFADANIHKRINKICEYGTEQPINYEIFKPGDPLSTVQLFETTFENGLFLGFDGIFGTYELANTGVMTFVPNAGTVPNANQFIPGENIHFLGNNGALIRMEVHSILSPTTLQLLGSGGGDVEPLAPVVGDNFTIFRIISNEEQIGSNVEGVNTTFLQDDIEEGDILEINETMELIILNVISDTELLVQSNSRSQTATNNWRIKRAKHSRRLQEYEICFKPCLGLFTLDKFLPGDWKLELTPHTNLKYQRYAIESLTNKIPDVEYRLEVVDLQFYIYKSRVSKAINTSESYEFTELRCQAQTITNQSLLNKAFVVNQNSHTFTIAYQKPDSGDDTRFSKTKFRMLNNYERNLRRYQLRLNGETLPTPLPDINIDTLATIEYATQHYYETLHYNGTIFLDEPEGLTSWLERGPYYSIKIPKKPGAKSNRLYVSSEFQGAPPENFLLLVFDHYYKGFKLNIQNGLVKNCERSIMVN